MQFDTPPRAKRHASAVVYEATVTVMNELGEMQRYDFEVTNYQSFLEKLDKCKQAIEKLYQFRPKDDKPY